MSRLAHAHEFAVAAACDGCGTMISEAMTAEKERADGNFKSYIRVRDLHTQAREEIKQLEREREADRAAIRACRVMFKSTPGWNVILLDHAGAVQRAIQRAQDAKG